MNFKSWLRWKNTDSVPTVWWLNHFSFHVTTCNRISLQTWIEVFCVSQLACERHHWRRTDPLQLKLCKFLMISEYYKMYSGVCGLAFAIEYITIVSRACRFNCMATVMCALILHSLVTTIIIIMKRTCIIFHSICQPDPSALRLPVYYIRPRAKWD